MLPPLVPVALFGELLAGAAVVFQPAANKAFWVGWSLSAGMCVSVAKKVCVHLPLPVRNLRALSLREVVLANKTSKLLLSGARFS